jgi:hypothetical protein
VVVKDASRSIWKKPAVAWFEIISQCLLGNFQKFHKTSARIIGVLA